jgi:ribosome-associated translation inhibitor RaiA
VRVEVRAAEVVLAEAMRDYIEQRLSKAVARAGDRVGRVTVQLTEHHGPLGHVDWRCRVSVERLPSGAIVQREVVGPRLLATIETASERFWCALHGKRQERCSVGSRA